jgi:hypothetical protein
MKHIGTNGNAIAAAALTLAMTSAFLVAPASAAASVKCAGINSCKGTSACATAKSACKGQNACKGQGWISLKSAKVCKSRGGHVL